MGFTLVNLGDFNDSVKIRKIIFFRLERFAEKYLMAPYRTKMELLYT